MLLRIVIAPITIYRCAAFLVFHDEPHGTVQCDRCVVLGANFGDKFRVKRLREGSQLLTNSLAPEGLIDGLGNAGRARYGPGEQITGPPASTSGNEYSKPCHRRGSAPHRNKKPQLS